MNKECIIISDETTEFELERRRRFDTIKGISLVIILKWLWLLLLVFATLSLVFTIHIVNHFAYSINRYSATTRLMYAPRSTMKVQAVSDKHIMGILDRASLKRRVGANIEMPELEQTCLTNDLRIKQEHKPNNFYTLTAYAATPKRAIAKVNEYAKVLIEEYETYRKNDLKQWSETLEQRKKTLIEQFAALDAEEATAKSKTGIISPVETLTLMNSMISDQRRNSSLISVQIANEEIKKKRLETTVGTLDKKILELAPQIRKKSQDLALIDAELVKLREIYTDINPKVLGKMDDREKLMKEYMDLLKANGIEDVSLKDVERVEQSVMELADVSLRLDVLAESLRSTENEIKTNEAKCETLTAAIPVLERINIKRDEIEKSLRDLNENLGDIEYLMMTASSDLHQIEESNGARDRVPLSVKNLILSIGAALLCTLLLTSGIIFFELVFGKVRNTRELAAYKDIHVLGSLPRTNEMSEEKEKEVLDVVSLNFCNSELPKGIVLVCRLPGARHLRKFSKELDWSLSMAGQRPFLLEIVSNHDFVPPEGSEALINTVRQGSMGWFPTSSKYALAPTEIQMFNADLQELRKEFDNVFVIMTDGVRHGGNFFRQLLEMSESALLLIGANSTPRSELKYVRKQAIATKRQMMGLVSGASIKEVRREMELNYE